MQTSGNIVVNGVTYTLGNTYSFKGNVSGKASSDGSGATAMSLNDLKSNYSEYSSYYPEMKLGAYNAGAAYPYALYYPSGFWGGGLHGWFPAGIFEAQAAVVTHSLVSKTETTITLKWSSTTDVTGIWYSVDGGSSFTYAGAASGKSGTYTITGRAANTTYSVVTRIKRKDTSVQVSSAALSVTTHDYPHAVTMPDFYIGDSVTIGIYNPLGRTAAVSLLNSGGTALMDGTVSTSGTSVTIKAADYNQSKMLQSIPNATSGKYTVKVTWNSKNMSNSGGNFKIKSGTVPIIGALSYKDTNATAISITGDNQKIVRNQSVPNFTAQGLQATDYATFSKCTVTVNGKTYNLTISGTQATGTGAVIDSATNVNAVITLTDSRGLTVSKTIELTMLDWYIPTATVSAKRQDGYYSETELTVNANYAGINGQNSVTIMYTATRSDSGATVSGTLEDNVTSVAVLDNAYAWTVKFTVTDAFGGTVAYTVGIAKGVPIIFFDKDKYSVGINCFPNDKALEVDGDVAITGDYYLNDGTTVAENLDEKLDKSTITTKTVSVTNKTVSTGTYTSLCSLSLEAGTWMLHGVLQGGSASSGDICAIINTSAGWKFEHMQKTKISSGGNVLDATAILTPTAKTTYYLVAYQNSGSNMTISRGYMEAVRIK